MANIKIGEKPLERYSPAELRAWLIVGSEEGGAKNRPQAGTLKLWAAIMRAFDEVGTPQTVRQVFYALTTRRQIEKTREGLPPGGGPAIEHASAGSGAI